MSPRSWFFAFHLFWRHAFNDQVSVIELDEVTFRQRHLARILATAIETPRARPAAPSMLRHLFSSPLP